EQSSAHTLHWLGCLETFLLCCKASKKTRIELLWCTTSITDCSLKNLTVENLPTAFRPSAEIIHLASNRLTSIPNGLFDNLRSLQAVYLQGNPWECTCDILYLRSWLQWQQNRSLYRDVRCSSPEHLQGRIIAYLTEDEIVSTCQHWYCSLALLSQLSLFILLILQAILVILIIVYLRKFRRMAAEVRSTTRELGQQGDPWESS
uniref:Uncharacterized protein n=2 Tax=Geospiza parvula TaxID=87175 RepID=A0A8C3NBF8_GEOPR